MALESIIVDVRKRKLSELLPDIDNPNIGDTELITQSMERFGVFDVLGVDADTDRVLFGNHRLHSLMEGGIDEHWCVHVRPKEVGHAEGISLASNQTAKKSKWDDNLLQARLDALDDVRGTGFSDYDLKDLRDRIAKDMAGNNINGDPDDIPDPPKEPITKTGDLWLLGEHRLLCGDSTQNADVGKLVLGKPCKMMFADPPYGVDYAGKNRFLNAIARGNAVQEPILGDHQTPEQMSEFWNLAFATVRKVLSAGASYYVTGPQGGDLLLLLLLSLRDSGFPLRHILIWAKNNHVLGRADYNYKHEPIIYGWVKGSHEFHGGGGETSLWEINKPHKSDLHPTMKPVELVARCIRNSSRPGDLILDPFGGSGTTLMAAHQEGRVACLVEIDPTYCDVICKRFQHATGILPRREDGTEVDFMESRL